MIGKNVIGLLIGLVLSVFDLFNMGTMKQISLHKFPVSTLWIVSLLYSIQPWIFLKGLNFTSMTVLNLSWDLLSDILVTLSGLFYFKEQLTEYKALGVMFSVLALILFGIDGTGSDT